MVKVDLKNLFILIMLSLSLGLTSLADLESHSSSSEVSSNLLRVGVSPTYPPIIFNQRGLISGIEADLANALAQFLNKPIQFVELPWVDQIPALLENKINIIMSGMSKTKERETQIAFTMPYYRLGQLPLVRSMDLIHYPTWRSIYFMEGRVGVIRGTTGEILVDDMLIRAEKIQFTSGEEATKALVRNRIDMVVYDSPFIRWVAEDYVDQGIVALAFSPLSEEQLAWGVRKDDNELLEGANRFLQEWEKNGQLEHIISKWVPK